MGSIFEFRQEVGDETFNSLSQITAANDIDPQANNSHPKVAEAIEKASEMIEKNFADATKVCPEMAIFHIQNFYSNLSKAFAGNKAPESWW
jgi:hypothetical protein